MTESLLTVKDLQISFPTDGEDNVVVRDLNFELSKGEILGIVGESGSGKSLSCLSLIKLIPGNGKIDRGSIHLNVNEKWVDITKNSEKELCNIRGRRIGMIFQEPMSSLNPTLTCGRQVEEAIWTHYPEKRNQAKQMVLAAFEEVQLPNPERIYQSYPHQLSGGQLQRVMIAMALINHPSIIIADEPTTALDVTVQKEVVNLLIDLKSKYNCSIIFVSHDLGLVNEICDRVIVMQSGEIVESGIVNDVFHNPQKAYTKGLLACRPPFNKRYKRLPTVPEILALESNDINAYLKGLEEDSEEFYERQRSLNQSDVIIEVKNLKKYYVNEKTWWGKVKSYTKAVDDVSFDIRKGEILGLVGESGSGKSTIGHTMLKLKEPTDGMVSAFGQSIFDLSSSDLRKLRKDIQIIFQDPYSSLNPKMKIGKAIMEPMKVHKLYSNNKIRKEKTIELLEAVGLTADHFDRYPHQFSGGQRQRISIARTLSLEPKFIVCDESVSALDVSIQAQILNLLKDIKSQFDLSYLFISHDLSVIKFFCDNVLVLQKGKIVESGDVEEVFNNPQSQYTQTLLAAIPK